LLSPVLPDECVGNPMQHAATFSSAITLSLSTVVSACIWEVTELLMWISEAFVMKFCKFSSVLCSNSSHDLEWFCNHIFFSWTGVLTCSVLVSV
jgi:hypothetical protein